MKKLLLLLFLAIPMTAEDNYDPNTFVRSFNIWAGQVRSIQSNATINTSEIRQWMEVKVEWEILKRQVDTHYAVKP